MKKNVKLARALHVLRMSCSGDEQREIVYAMMAETGFYWDVAHKKWIHANRASFNLLRFYGEEVATEYRLILQRGGILSESGTRTELVNLPSKYGKLLMDRINELIKEGGSTDAQD